jgi:hypothetical protein
MNTIFRQNRISFIDWFLSIFLILAQYSFIGDFSSYGIVILLSYSFIQFVFVNKNILFHKYLLLLVSYIIFISIINIFRFDNLSTTLVNSLIEIILIFVAISILIPTFNFNNFYRFYQIVGLIALSILYVQAIRLYIFGLPAIPVTILPVLTGQEHFWGNMLGKRPSSLFSEPQAYASFMVPLLLYYIKKKKIIFAHIVSISILLSTSSLGIIIVSYIYIYTIILKRDNSNRKIQISFVFIILILMFIRLEIFSFSLNKIIEIEIFNNIRLTRGFLVYSTFSLWDILLGISNTLQSYISITIQETWVTTYYTNGSERLLGYVTSVAGMFIRHGLVAGILYLFMFFKMFQNEDKDHRIFLYIIIIMSFGQTLFFNAWFVFYYIIYLGSCNKINNNSNYLAKKRM